MGAHPSDSLLGSVVDRRYRVDQRVGAGAFGCVYSAWHLSLDVRVALKVLTLDPDLGESERDELVARFLNEARVLTRLKHPGIVAALDLGTVVFSPGSAPVPYLVMEWCDGQTLSALLSTRGRFSLKTAFEIVEPLADALAHAHAASVLHRDIKPSNVMISESAAYAKPRLIDFGIAKHAPARGAASGAESVTIGAPPYTAAYAAPEQVAGARTSPATDVHALGLLFIELVTGEPPYGNGADPELAIIDAVRPSAAREGVETGAFEPVIARAVALRAADRYADGRALRDALQGAAREQLGERHPVPSARRALADRRPLAWATGFAALLTVGTIAILRAGPQVAEQVPSSTSPTPAVPFCELDEAGLRERVVASGFTIQGFTRGWALLEGRDQRAVTIESTAVERAGPAPRQILDTSQAAIEELGSLGMAYALDGDCLVYTKGARADVVPALDALLGDHASLERGDTCGGPDPLSIGRVAPAPWQGTAATHLGALSAREYVARALALGLRVHDAHRSEKKLGDWFQLSFKHGDAYGRLEYFSGPYVRTLLVKKLSNTETVVYYAIEEPVAIVAHGLPDPSLLDALVGGLAIPVQRSPP